MAIFRIDIGDAKFYVIKQPEITTECSTTYIYNIYAKDGDLINISLVGNHVLESYTSNGVVTTFSDTATGIVYDRSLSLTFVLNNSGSSGIFENTLVTITDTTTSDEPFIKTEVRYNDGDKCGPLQGNVILTYDELTDTPNSKIGHKGKIIVVSEDELMHEYADMPPMLTQDDLDAIYDLIYKNFESTISVSPSNGERGVSRALTVSYEIKSNDDVITSATINQGIGDVMSSVDDGIKSTSGGTSLVDKTFILDLEYTRKGVPMINSKNVTYLAHIPQWAGWSSSTDFTNIYSNIDSEPNFQKYIQASPTIEKDMSPVNEYVWFISNKSNAKVYDTNTFLMISGPWGNPTSEIWTKPLTITLADGLTTAIVYLYRTRQTKSLSTFTYKIA